MSSEEFKKGLSEEYQGELVGEAFFSEVSKRFKSPPHQYKVATLLQLETETAARLRPAVLELGIELSYLDEYRRMGDDFLKACEGMDWTQFIAFLQKAVGPFVERYTEIAAIAPAEYKDLADSMVVHEKAIQLFTSLELSGDTEHSLDKVVEQLKFPLKQPS